MSDVSGAGTAASGIAQAAAAVTTATIQADATKAAAKMQVDSANRSADLVQGRYTQTRGDFEPYRLLGNDAAGRFNGQTIDQYGNPQQMTQGGNLLDTAYRSIPDARTVGTMPTVPGAFATPDMPATVATPDMAATVALPPRMTQAELEQTPGYQFARSQGLQSVQNSAAARGLGVSGAAMKGAATFATGLADNTYQAQFAQQQQLFSDAFNQGQAQFGNRQTGFQDAFNQGQAQFGNRQTSFQDAYTQGQGLFGNQQTNYGNANNANQLLFANQQQRFTNLTGLNTANQGNLQNSFNRLSGLTTIGQTSAAQTGAIGNASANQAGQLITGGATAGAAGLIAGGNATASGINSIANAFGQYQAQNRLMGGGGNMYGGEGVSSQYAQKDDPFGGRGGGYY